MEKLDGLIRLLPLAARSYYQAIKKKSNNNFILYIYINNNTTTIIIVPLKTILESLFLLAFAVSHPVRHLLYHRAQEIVETCYHNQTEPSWVLEGDRRDLLKLN